MSGEQIGALGLVAALFGGAVAAVVWAPAQGPRAAHPASEASAFAPDAGEEPTVHIAMMRDFAGFPRWTRHAVDGAMLPVGVADGPTYIYANRAPPRGQARWPVGTILVKVIESGPRPEDWTVHAMVKRGLPYNGDGAVGWEFFELRLEGGLDADPLILWRGPGPPSGHGYAAVGRDAGVDDIPLVCNDCHAANWRDDGVLTPALALR